VRLRADEQPRLHALPVEIDDAVEMGARLGAQVLQPEPEPLRVEAHEAVAGVDELAAALRVLARREVVAHRVDTSAGTVACLDDRHPASGALELVGADEAGEAGSDDDDVGRLRRCAEGTPCTGRQRGAGGPGEQLAPSETGQGRSSYAGSVR